MIGAVEVVVVLVSGAVEVVVELVIGAVEVVVELIEFVVVLVLFVVSVTPGFKQQSASVSAFAWKSTQLL